MKLKFGLLIGLLVVLLAGCGEPTAEDFAKTKTYTNVKVVKVDTVLYAKQNYTQVKFIKDGKTREMRYENVEDYGFEEYYKSAKLFKDNIYVNLIFIDRKGTDEDHILAVGLSE